MAVAERRRNLSTKETALISNVYELNFFTQRTRACRMSKELVVHDKRRRKHINDVRIYFDR